MKRLHVEKELLDEYKMLLEIPRTREFLHCARESCKIEFADHIKQYLENTHKPGEPGVNAGINESDPGFPQESMEEVQGIEDQNEPGSSSYRFDFHLVCRDGDWKPVIDLSSGYFQPKDLMPDDLIEFITAHTMTKYEWYYIEKREFRTPTYGVLEFNVQFKYMERDFITGIGEIPGVEGLETDGSQHTVCDENKIIHMNKNRAQMVEIILRDLEACEFLHYFCTFPFYRHMILQNFKSKDRHLLWDRFDHEISSDE